MELYEIKGKQKTLDGKSIDIKHYKDYDKKRKEREEVLRGFKGSYFRSIIKGKGEVRLDRLDRLSRKECESAIDYEKRKSDSFSKKTLETISVFPSEITMVYTVLLSKEGDKVYDAFTGHNSRAEDVLSLGRLYYGYDCHKFPVDFTKKAVERFDSKNYEINLGSSERIKYLSNYFDFSLTCPPYSDVEKYNELYKEKVSSDLSSMSYELFLKTYLACLSETYRVLKKDAFFVLVVGDKHTSDGYKSLMYDTIKMCLELGFKLHDINIYNRGSNIGGDLNYNQFIKVSKRLPTIHEYILIFQKVKLSEENIDLIDDVEVKKIMEENKGLVSREGAIKILEMRKTREEK